MYNKKINYFNKGVATLYVLFFSALFLMIISSLIGFAVIQTKSLTVKENKSRAFQIAEAGLSYYKWFLAHFPNDLQDGTGMPGPYEHEYSDPEAGATGKFSLAVTGVSECNTVTAVDINSTGWTYDKPQYKKEVYGRYARPSVASYAYILNSNVWAGPDRNIKGKYHSNGGIRMDGTNQSLVTSAQKDWLCTASFGCATSSTTDGVFGAGTGSSLWSFPVEPIDFVGLTVDLINMKTQAQASGLYFGPVGGQSKNRGYHMVFKANGTVDVYKVKKIEDHLSLHIDDLGGGWKKDYYTIEEETFLQNYTIPTGCSLVFSEDKLWIDGTIKDKVTVVAADVSQPNYDPDVIINGNIDYTTLDGSDGLTVVAENSIVLGVEIPSDISLRGIYVAQKGYFGRNLYGCWHAPHDQKNSLTMSGTIVSDRKSVV